MQIFARLTKVNEAERTVEGVIANETPDLSGEIFDYDRSKPHFEKWSETIAKATDGKNLGNVRAMHGNVSAGITKNMIFDDMAKEITVKAEITDENEWNKVKKGNYTGFSIGGRYGDTWPDPALGKKRYEAIPNEYSLVDIPCNTTALFTVVKADGTQEMRKFVTTMDNAEALAKWAEGLSDNERATILSKIAARNDVSPKEGENKYGDVKFADEKNKKYPIDTPAHIRAAWNYINRPHNASKYDAADLKTIKAKIVAAWKEKIDSNGPPSAKKDDKKAEKSAYFDCVASMLIEKKAGESLAKAAGELVGMPLSKGLYTCSELACLLERLSCLADGVAWETAIEGDHSALPDEINEAVKNLGELLIHMVDEEVEELLAGDDVEVIALSDKGDLTKALNNGEDLMNAELQKKFDDSQAALAKMTGERDELQKALDVAATSIKERDELLTKAAEALDQRNAIIEKFNNAPQPVKAALMSVSKSADSVNAVEVEPVKNADGSVDQAATEIKKALLNPVVRR